MIPFSTSYLVCRERGYVGQGGGEGWGRGREERGGAEIGRRVEYEEDGRGGEGGKK